MVKENDDIRCNDPGTPSQLLPGARGQGQTWEGPGCWGRKERPPTKINRQNKTFIGSIWLNWKGSRGNVKPTFFFSKNFLNSGGIGLLRWNEQDLAHQTLLYCGVHDALGARRGEQQGMFPHWNQSPVQLLDAGGLAKDGDWNGLGQRWG